MVQYLKKYCGYLKEYYAIFNKILWNTDKNAVQYLKKYCGIRTICGDVLGGLRQECDKRRDAAHRPIRVTQLLHDILHCISFVFLLYFFNSVKCIRLILLV